MSFIATSDLASAASFRTRLTSCIVKVAGTVLDEDQSAHPDPVADKRLTLAQSILREPTAQAQAFIWPVLSNGAIAAAGLDATDADLEYQVTQVWDSLAGVTRADANYQPPTPPAPLTPDVSYAHEVRGLTVAFWDNSTNSPTGYSWDFGDGNTDTVKNPTHTFTAAGVHTVTLQAINQAGSGTYSQTVTVVAPA